MPHGIREHLETPAVIVLVLPLLHLTFFLLEWLLMPVYTHASPVGHLLFIHRLTFRSVVFLFGFIHSIVKGEMINERTMVSVGLLLVLQMESGHLDGS